MAGFVRRLTMSAGTGRVQEVTPPDEEDAVLKTGSLMKKGHIRRNWLSRYFVLRPSGLYYYKSAEAYEADLLKPLGIVMIFGAAVQEDMFQRKPNVFSIWTADGKDYHMQATSKQDMDDWLVEINKAMKLGNQQRLSRPNSVASAGR